MNQIEIEYPFPSIGILTFGNRTLDYGLSIYPIGKLIQCFLILFDSRQKAEVSGLLWLWPSLSLLKSVVVITTCPKSCSEPERLAGALETGRTNFSIVCRDRFLIIRAIPLTVAVYNLQNNRLKKFLESTHIWKNEKLSKVSFWIFIII